MLITTKETNIIVTTQSEYKSLLVDVGCLQQADLLEKNISR